VAILSRSLGPFPARSRAPHHYANSVSSGHPARFRAWAGAMMQLVPGSKRLCADDRTDPVEGRVRWAPAKSLWIGTMTSAAIVFGPLAFSWDAFVLFVATSAVTLCFGHSVGMHRRLIHESFECPLWLEHLCVYLGTLVGMAGPIGMVRLHDFRDWAQRQPACHDYSCHRAGFWRDGWWQLHAGLPLSTRLCSSPSRGSPTTGSIPSSSALGCCSSFHGRCCSMRSAARVGSYGASACGPVCA
jgi:hypothetical protein